MSPAGARRRQVANLQRQLKGWVRHWYLAAKGARPYLTRESKKQESKAYREVMAILGNEKVISKEASPLS